MLIVQPRPSFLMSIRISSDRARRVKVRQGPPKLTSRTADATDYSERTVRRIVAEKKSLEGATFGSPAKRYKVERKKIIVDDFDMEGIYTAHCS